MINTTPFIKSLNGKPVAIFGLGMSGLATARALMKSGGPIAAWDDSDEKRGQAASEGVPLHDFIKEGMEGYGALVLAPGIPLHFPAPHKAALKASEAGVEIIGDLEVLYRSQHGATTIGITGTNGKSTTTALITHVLKEAGRDAQMGGNIGRPVLELTLSKNAILVLEISSYQMDLCPLFRPDIAVLLNISADHLDRHGSLEGYARAKERIFEGNGIGVCGIDDAISLAIYEKALKLTERKIIPVSVKKEIAGGVFIKDGMLIDFIEDEQHEIGTVSDIAVLPGVHNQQNICAAYAVCKNLGVDADHFMRHIRTYPGLPHRQFLTRVINGIAYINDSKATNAEAAAKAIACYHNIYLIAGGEAKAGGLNGLEPYIDRINHVFLIGQATEEFAKWLEHTGVPYTRSHTLDIAVLEAHRAAQENRGQPGGAATVLLSPACASWDQFNNFEHRGNVFTDLVNTLSENVTI